MEDLTGTIVVSDGRAEIVVFIQHICALIAVNGGSQLKTRIMLMSGGGVDIFCVEPLSVVIDRIRTARR